MGYEGSISRKERLASAGISLLLAGLIGIGLVMGLDLAKARKDRSSADAISLAAAQLPAEQSPADAIADDAAPAPESAANLKAAATAVTAPQPKIVPAKIPDMTAAPAPRDGSAASSGASDRPGPGSGAAGAGDGSGSGGSGNGAGGGSRAIWRSGSIEDRDYPDTARRARAGGTVETSFTIETSGRVTGCRVTRSSGEPSLDATTCRLIEKRFRFRPATDAEGRPVASRYGWRQTWWLERRD